MSAADRVTRHHGDDRLGKTPDLDLEVEHVEASDPGRVPVAVIAADALVTARAERLGSRAGEHDDPDRRVVARHLEGACKLEERGRPERIAHLGPVDGQLGDAAGGLVANVLPLAGRDPLHDGMHLALNSNRSLSMVARQGPGGRRGTLAA